jgi:acetate---CoA ligase (ADP-forming) subunit alpha
MTSFYDAVPLYPMINPRSIAFFGASNRYTTMGTNQLNSVLSLGFKGDIYPIHPTEKTVLGLCAYKAVQDLPAVPDLAVLVLPTPLVARTLEACGQKGIRHAIVVSGGFNEVGGQGAAMEKELIAIAQRYNMRFIGPNCLGVVNPHHLFNVTFANFEGRPGFIGMASQSGSLLTQMFRYLEGFHIGFSSGISVGNEADVDLVDCLEYLSACPHTRVIALYIESIRRGRRFIETARRIAPHKPIVAYYAGGSEAGRRAAFSHTGALAGPDRLYDGVFAQSGIVRAASLTELFDFAWVLGMCAIPKSHRIIIQTHSGGPGAAAADACSRNGLELPQFSENTLTKLRPLVPHTGSMNNPVDLTFSRDPMEYFRTIPQVLLEESDADGLLLYCFTPQKNVMRIMQMERGLSPEEAKKLAEQMADQQSRRLADLIRLHTKPVIGFSYQGTDALIIRKLLENGIPVLPSPERAARAMSALVRYSRLKQKWSGPESFTDSLK